MVHVRQTIRSAIVAAITGLITTGTNVFQSRVYPMESAKLPGLIVYTLNEDSNIDTMVRPRGLNRTVTVAVEAYVKATLNIDNTLDTICAEVETALGNTFPGGAQNLALISTDFDLNGEGHQKHGTAKMIFGVQYRTREDLPEATL